MALVDGNYKFIYDDVGCSGRISGGGVSVIPSLLPSLPYVIVTDGDDDSDNDELIL